MSLIANGDANTILIFAPQMPNKTKGRMRRGICSDARPTYEREFYL